MAKTNKRLVENPRLVEKRRPQIITAAIEQFGRNGFHATTIRDVAERAGVSIGMIYQYVQDKEELLYLSVIEIIEHYLREIEVALADLDDPLERYIAIVTALTIVIDEHRPAAVLGYRESKSLTRDHMDYIVKREREIGDMVSRCIKACIEAGVFRNVDAEMLMYQSIVFAHNWALNAWRFKRQMNVDTYVAKGLAVILDPVLATPAAVDLKKVLSDQRRRRKASAKGAQGPRGAAGIAG